MDEYTSLGGTSIITPPHGKVSGLAAKRRIGERKRRKREGREKREKDQEGVVVHGWLQESLEQKDIEGPPVEKDPNPDEEDAVTRYGKRVHGNKRKSKIDLTI
jgi:hypothetical protein